MVDNSIILQHVENKKMKEGIGGSHTAGFHYKAHKGAIVGLQQ
jgi:hypothetical protein